MFFLFLFVKDLDSIAYFWSIPVALCGVCFGRQKISDSFFVVRLLTFGVLFYLSAVNIYRRLSVGSLSSFFKSKKKLHVVICKIAAGFSFLWSFWFRSFVLFFSKTWSDTTL